MEQVLGILYPRRCPVCGEIVMPKGELVCPDCVGKIRYVTEPKCKKCGKTIVQETKEYCRDCEENKRSFVQGIVLVNYTQEVRSALGAVKYGNLRQNLDFFCQELVTRYDRQIGNWQAEALIPVPLHPAKKRQRGFNQAEEIAGRLSKGLGIPVDTKLLCRRKRTTPQKDLNGRQRLANLIGAFGVSRAETGYKRVILVDDIYTTGSTAEACTRALLKAGVEEVYVICIAAGMGD